MAGSRSGTCAASRRRSASSGTQTGHDRDHDPGDDPEGGLPVLVVVGSKLGCINHALLTLSELERRGISVLGYVLNELEAASDRG